MTVRWKGHKMWLVKQELAESGTWNGIFRLALIPELGRGFKAAGQGAM